MRFAIVFGAFLIANAITPISSIWSGFGVLVACVIALIFDLAEYGRSARSHQEAPGQGVRSK